MHVDCESGVAQELNEFFSFYVPGYKFMPAFRNRMWDGKIRLYNIHTQELYAGLLDYVKHFAEEREIWVGIDFEEVLLFVDCCITNSQTATLLSLL